MSILKVFLLVPVLGLCLFIPDLYAEMSSTNYRLTSSVISGGGSVMSSVNYRLESTLGQSPPTDNSSSISYGIDSGFWYRMLYDVIGDVDGDGSVDVEDVIASLQVATGQLPATVTKKADADGGGRIGLGEA